MTRVLILCTHNSARSQMAEGWVRHYAKELKVALEVVSAGTEKARVKPEAVTVMREVGVDLPSHTSKTLAEVSDPWNFSVVVTVCDAANEACPLYPTETARYHVSFPDPSGHALESWRRVRDALGAMSLVLVAAAARGETPAEAALVKAAEPFAEDLGREVLG